MSESEHHVRRLGASEDHLLRSCFDHDMFCPDVALIFRDVVAAFPDLY